MLRGYPWQVAAAVAIAAGAVIGCVNGLLTARLVGFVPLFPSFLPTLAMYWIAIGVAEAFLPSQQAITIVDPDFGDLFAGNLPIVYAVVTVVLVHLLLTRTAFGYRVFAVGSNRKAAALAGIDVVRTKFAILAVSGLLCGVGGVFEAGYFQGGYSRIAQGIELDAIGAAVIGGTALFGGRGNVLASLSGVLVLSVLNTGLLLMQVSPAIALAAKGVLVITAVALNLYIRRRFSDGAFSRIEGGRTAGAAIPG
jgi:ribose/xylose/arabinose/galactoside ABC-type transport system permease subunit